MPAYRAKSNKKKDINTAVSRNMKELYKSPKGRSRQQLIAIAFAEARAKKKKK